MTMLTIPSATATLERLTPALDSVTDPAHAGMALPCHVLDAELWFAETPQGVDEAKALCRTCPVRAACLDGALERREPWGVWGGELFAQGVIVPRKRPRGRPRKSDAA